MISHIFKKDWGTEPKQTANTAMIAVACAPTSFSPFEFADKYKDVRNPLLRMAAVHQKQVAKRGSFRQPPTHFVIFIEVVLLALNDRLNPDFGSLPEIPLQLYYLN
jgi:hypothetical protein